MRGRFHRWKWSLTARTNCPAPGYLQSTRVSDGDTGVELCPEVVLDPAIPVELERLSLELE